MNKLLSVWSKKKLITVFWGKKKKWEAYMELTGRADMIPSYSAISCHPDRNVLYFSLEFSSMHTMRMSSKTTAYWRVD